jgi:hypothetical protein
VPSAGSITFSYPQGDKITAFPGAKTVRVKLNGNVPLATYQAIFYAKGPNGTPAHQRTATIRVLASQTLAVSVTATPQQVCPGGSTQLQSFTSGGIPPFTYTWTSNPPGFTSSAPNPSASPTVPTRYICTVHDNAAHVAKDSVQVTIGTLPAAPGVISGNVAPCTNTAADYSIAPVAGATTYTWAVPSGSQILSGQTTTMISVLWGNTAGNVSVTAGNSCGNSTPALLAVAPAPVPATPEPISGPTVVCTGATAGFSVPPATGVTFTWTVPSDATITAGQGTDAITVQWGTTAGFVSVIAQTGACTSLPGSLGVNAETVAGAAQTIAGSDTVCQGEGGFQYSIPLISNASSYTWSIPAGAVITGGQGTNAILVDFGNTAVSGTMTVAGSNMCGTGQPSSKEIIVQVCTGTDDEKLRSGIVIYPNPVHGMLNVAITGAEKQLEIRITDLNGRNLYEEKFDNLPGNATRQVDVSSFAKGVYLVRLTGSSRVFTSKFTVD